MSVSASLVVTHYHHKSLLASKAALAASLPATMAVHEWLQFRFQNWQCKWQLLAQTRRRLLIFDQNGAGWRRIRLSAQFGAIGAAITSLKYLKYNYI